MSSNVTDYDSWTAWWRICTKNCGRPCCSATSRIASFPPILLFLYDTVLAPSSTSWTSLKLYAIILSSRAKTFSSSSFCSYLIWAKYSIKISFYILRAFICSAFPVFFVSQELMICRALFKFESTLSWFCNLTRSISIFPSSVFGSELPIKS